MKFTFNKYWMFIAICIIANIFIFMFMSNRLENFVADAMVEKQDLNK